MSGTVYQKFDLYDRILLRQKQVVDWNADLKKVFIVKINRYAHRVNALIPSLVERQAPMKEQSDFRFRTHKRTHTVWKSNAWWFHTLET